MTRSRLGLLLAGLLAIGMWCYVDLILVPYQIADAARVGRPRGNLSDLYPRWLGARELLLHHRDPYSSEITREIQVGYYGRPVDPARPNDPKDQQGFAYPVYVVFLLAPSIWFPFSAVQVAFRVLLLLLIVASVLLWLDALQWRVSWTGKLIALVLVLGSFPAVQAIRLQQLSAVACFLVALCTACVVRRRLVPAGVALALATIKPQLALPFAAWLLLWSVGDWRSRQKLIWSFLATLAILVIGGELLLPGWISQFRAATAAYLRYTGGTSPLDLSLTPTWGRVVSLIVILGVAYVCWRWHRAPADSAAFRWSLAFVLAGILVVIPTFAPYNQLLLIGALLLLAQQAPRMKHGHLQRLALAMVLVVVLAPLITATAMDLSLLFLPRVTVERVWMLPLWSSWAIPFPILAAVSLCAGHAIREEHSETRGLAAKIN